MKKRAGIHQKDHNQTITASQKGSHRRQFIKVGQRSKYGRRIINDTQCFHEGNETTTNYTDRTVVGVDHGREKSRRPPIWVIIVTVMTLSFRVHHVTDRNNWVTIHPDEVFQSIEVAHTEYFGYGFRPYEYSSHYEDTMTNDTTTYRQMELDAGMSSMRSPIYPYFYVCVAHVTSALGVTSNPYLIFLVAHVIVTSLLPVSVYCYATQLFHSKTTGTIAAILTAASIHLHVLGTHCLLHSFLSPFIFATLSLAVSLANRNHRADVSSRTTQVVGNSIHYYNDDNCDDNNNNTTNQNNNNNDNDNNNVISNNNNNNNNTKEHVKRNAEKTSSNSHQHSLKTESSHSTLPHQLKLKNGFNNVLCVDLSPNDKVEKEILTLTLTTTKEAFHFPNNYKVFPRDNDRMFLNKCFIVGFISALTCYIRPDAALIHLVTLIVMLFKFKSSSSSSNLWRRCYGGMKIFISCTAFILLGAMLSLLLGIFADTKFYGGLTITPLNWFTTNVINDVSSSVFGKMPSWFYLKALYSDDVFMCVLFVFSLTTYSMTAMLSIFQRIQRYYLDKSHGGQTTQRAHENHNNKCKDTLPLHVLIILLSPLVIYSIHGHKEMRFIHDALVLVIVITSSIISNAMSIIDSYCITERVKLGIKTKPKIFLYIILVTISAFQWRHFAQVSSSSTRWTYQHASDTQDTNACLEFISKQPDVRGVFLDDNLFKTGGMTILHKNVPIFTRLMNGFLEFNFDSRINSTTTTTSSFGMKTQFNLHDNVSKNNTLSRENTTHHNNNNNVPLDGGAKTKITTRSVNTFTRASNYVSQTNGEGVLRMLLEHQHYNYLVLTHDQPFVKMDYHTVFHHGNRRVMKRGRHVDSQLRIQFILDRLPMGKNTTTLIHEGDVLYHMRLYAKAVVRYQFALKMAETTSSSGDSEAVTAYFPLHDCLKQMGRHSEAEEVRRRCVRLFDQKSCWTARRMTRL